MPRVHFVQKARKDNPAVKKGESYFWWKFRYGGKRYSATRPRQSQLTQSAYFGQLYSLQEMIEDYEVNDNDDFTSLRDEVASELDNLRDETQGSLDNMPESLTYSPTGELLQERVDACENAQSEVENIDEFDDEEPDLDDFEEDCPECSGAGYIATEDDDDEECPDCKGEGKIEGREEFEQAMSEYQDKLSEWCSTVKDEMIEFVGEAVV